MEVLIKKEEEPGDLGYYPEERPIEYHIKYGIVNLDKPSGPTSHQVTSWVANILNVRKAGHSGTLDPRVTGVLPIGLQFATKVLHVLLLSGKEYIALMHLHKKVEEERIKEIMKRFVGEIIQTPPVRSRVKRVPRKRKVYYLDIIEINGKDVLFRAGVQAGTYIRKLCDDIGRELGVGAHMEDLRRTKVGPFNEEERLVTLQDLSDAWYFYKEEGKEKFLRYCIFPVEKAVELLPKVWVTDAAVASITKGAQLAAPGIVKLHKEIKKGDMVAIMSLKDELVALARAQRDGEEMLKASRGIVCKLERVVLPQHLYNPKR